MVTQRIKAALRKIAEASPALGRHLANAIHTGLFCSYQPPDPTSLTSAHRTGTGERRRSTPTA
jgi:hypothetical protein